MPSRFAGRCRDASRSRGFHALLVLTFLIAARAEAQRARYTPEIFRQTFLENGLEVIAVRNPSSPMATVIVAVRGGGATQSTELLEGIPHYLEHLLFKSSSTFGAEVSLADGGFNGSTDEEVVKYFITLPGKNAPSAIKSLGTLVRSPKFRDEDMKTEINVVANEVERHISDQRFLLDFTVDQELWGTAWSRKNVGGNKFALLRATPQSIESFYRTF
jgi:predicted Zn-dependent peptidase